MKYLVCDIMDSLKVARFIWIFKIVVTLLLVNQLLF